MITRTFKFQRDTKRTYRFEEEADSNQQVAVGILYVQKDAFDAQPDRIKVTIEEVTG